MDWIDHERVIIERCNGIKGEIQLQRRGREYEIIYNGVFLMSTYNGVSERAAVGDALKNVGERSDNQMRVLMGGLGMGFSLQETLKCPQVQRVVVAEIEPVVIRWNQEHLGEENNRAVSDPRVELVNIDFAELLKEKAEQAGRSPHHTYQVVMVDTDNGSSWLSLPSNSCLYRDEGLNLIIKCLSPGGVACFWCSKREGDFEQRLRNYFQEVHFKMVKEKTGLEGAYYLAQMAEGL